MAIRFQDIAKLDHFTDLVLQELFKLDGFINEKVKDSGYKFVTITEEQIQAMNAFNRSKPDATGKEVFAELVGKNIISLEQIRIIKNKDFNEEYQKFKTTPLGGFKSPEASPLSSPPLIPIEGGEEDLLEFELLDFGTSSDTEADTEYPPANTSADTLEIFSDNNKDIAGLFSQYGAFAHVKLLPVHVDVINHTIKDELTTEREEAENRTALLVKVTQLKDLGIINEDEEYQVKGDTNILFGTVGETVALMTGKNQAERISHQEEVFSGRGENKDCTTVPTNSSDLLKTIANEDVRALFSPQGIFGATLLRAESIATINEVCKENEDSQYGPDHDVALKVNIFHLGTNKIVPMPDSIKANKTTVDYAKRTGQDPTEANTFQAEDVHFVGQEPANTTVETVDVDVDDYQEAATGAAFDRFNYDTNTDVPGLFSQYGALAHIQLHAAKVDLIEEELFILRNSKDYPGGETEKEKFENKVDILETIGIITADETKEVKAESLELATGQNPTLRKVLDERPDKRTVDVIPFNSHHILQEIANTDVYDMFSKDGFFGYISITTRNIETINNAAPERKSYSDVEALKSDIDSLVEAGIITAEEATAAKGRPYMAITGKGHSKNTHTLEAFRVIDIRSTDGEESEETDRLSSLGSTSPGRSLDFSGSLEHDTSLSLPDSPRSTSSDLLDPLHSSSRSPEGFGVSEGTTHQNLFEICSDIKGIEYNFKSPMYDKKLPNDLKYKPESSLEIAELRYQASTETIHSILSTTTSNPILGIHENEIAKGEVKELRTHKEKLISIQEILEKRRDDLTDRLNEINQAHANIDDLIPADFVEVTRGHDVVSVGLDDVYFEIDRMDEVIQKIGTVELREKFTELLKDFDKAENATTKKDLFKQASHIYLNVLAEPIKGTLGVAIAPIDANQPFDASDYAPKSLQENLALATACIARIDVKLQVRDSNFVHKQPMSYNTDGNNIILNKKAYQTKPDKGKNQYSIDLSSGTVAVSDSGHIQELAPTKTVGGRAKSLSNEDKLIAGAKMMAQELRNNPYGIHQIRGDAEFVKGAVYAALKIKGKSFVENKLSYNKKHVDLRKVNPKIKGTFKYDGKKSDKVDNAIEDYSKVRKAERAIDKVIKDEGAQGLSVTPSNGH